MDVFNYRQCSHTHTHSHTYTLTHIVFNRNKKEIIMFSIQPHVRVLKSPIQLGAKTYYPGSKEVGVY